MQAPNPILESLTAGNVAKVGFLAGLVIFQFYMFIDLSSQIDDFQDRVSSKFDDAETAIEAKFDELEKDFEADLDEVNEKLNEQALKDVENKAILRDIGGDIIEMKIEIDSISDQSKELNEKLIDNERKRVGMEFRLSFVEDKIGLGNGAKGPH